MSLLNKLIQSFANRKEVPVEVDEVRNAVIALGVQDKIVFHAAAADPAKISGAFYQFTRRSVVYGEPELCTLITFNSNLPVSMQRVVCCKEIIHIFDRDEERTNTLEHMTELASKLLGPMSTEDFGLSDLMATKDKIALYQSLPLLFPAAARNAAITAIASGRHSAETVAAQACLPLQLVKLMLTAEWPGISDDFLKNC